MREPDATSAIATICLPAFLARAGALAALVSGLLLCPAVATAATIRAQDVPSSIQVGETKSVNLTLDLGPGEQASLFEGHFSVSGIGFVDARLTPGSSSWSSSVGNLNGSGNVDLSLISAANSSASRVVATLLLTGRQPGVLDLRLNASSFASSDTSAVPFSTDLTLDTQPGSSLATILVGGPTFAPVPAIPARAVAVLGSTLLMVAGMMLAASRSLQRPD